MQRDTVRYIEMERDTVRYRDIQRYTEIIQREIQNTDMYRETEKN